MQEAAGNGPLISVITVCFNAKKELSETFRSVREQDSNLFEYVIIDGDSKDGSKELFESNADIIDVLISEADQGIYDAMNKGMKNSKAPFLWFMNAGDLFYEADTVKKVCEHLKLSGAWASYGDAMLIDVDHNQLGLRRGSAPRELGFKSLKYGMEVCHQAFVVHRDCVSDYSLDYKISSDIDWMLRILKKCGPFQKHEAIYCNFLIGGISSNIYRKSWKERYKVLSSHYGLLPNFFNHIIISLRYILQKLKG